MLESADHSNEARAPSAEAGGVRPDDALRQVDGMRLFPPAAFVLALLPALLLLPSAPFNPDEVESFRATRWVAEGLVPFRDFWEHHLPLHWFLLSPFAPLTGSASVESFLLLRLAQLPLLAATLFAAARALARAGVSRAASLFGLSLFFLAIHRSVVEIRIDVTMNLFLLVGLLALTWDAPEKRGRPALLLLGGVSLGLACLASQRAIPVALAGTVTGAVAVAVQRLPAGLRRSGQALLLAVAGLAAVATATLTAAYLTGALPALWEQCFRLNYLYERLGPTTAAGPSTLDWASRFLARPGAVALVVLAAAGTVLGLRDRSLRPLTASVALFAVTSAGLLYGIRSPFPYQFQTLFWFLALLSAVGLDALMRASRRVAVAAACIATTFALAGMVLALRAVRWDVMSDTIAHQDHVLRTIERASPPGSVVLEGCGFAVNRVPALETWFLPSLARELMSAGALHAATPADLVARRVALVVADSRLLATIKDDPSLGPFVARNFFPLERFVWLPAPNALLGPGGRAEWTVLSDGPHRFVEAPFLVSHPWFTNPWAFPFQRPRTSAAYRFDIRTLPTPDVGALRILLDGVPITPGPRTLVTLTSGSRLVVENASPSARAILVVPAAFPVVFDAPHPSSFIEPGLEF